MLQNPTHLSPASLPGILLAITSLYEPEPRPSESAPNSRASGMTLKIRVKPIVRKFLLHYLGSSYRLNQADPYGIMLLVLCQKKAEKHPRAGALGRYTAEFEVSGNTHVLLKNGFQGSLSALCTVQFNNFVEGVFKTEFHTMAYAYTQYQGRTIQKAIDDFMAKFNLTADDIDPMSLRRSYQRYKLRYDSQHRDLAAHRQRHGLKVEKT